MNTLILTAISSIIIGAVASFIVWFIPAEKFEPRLKIKTYNQKIVEETITNKDGNNEIRQFLKRNIHIANDSTSFAAYNITCFAELLDGDNNIVYHEEKKLPVAKANVGETNAIVVPLGRIPVAKIKNENVIKIELNLVCENRYGTKKTSGPWWIHEYNINQNSFVPKLEEKTKRK